MIRKKKGIHIDGDKKVIADGNSLEEVINLLSHAHADHAFKSDASNVICSDKTRRIMEKRFNVSTKTKEIKNVKLKPSGHIVGSSAALIDKNILYTGDVSLQDRVYLDGFNPVEAEKLIIESTYGVPSYILPRQREVVSKIKDWLKDNQKQTIFLFGYSLGKAQKIQHIVQEVTDRPILANSSVLKMNRVVEEVTDLDFRAKSYKENKEKLDKGILIAPSRSSRAEWVQKLVKKHEGVKAGFSGWAINKSFKYRGKYDKTFALSDHCGFEDLLKLVESVDPEKVYTHHGFEEEFASYLKREKGFNARALKNNQSSLDQF